MDIFFQEPTYYFLQASYWQLVFSLCGIWFLLDAFVMASLTGPHRAERSHYLLSIAAVVAYIGFYQFDSEEFRNLWMQTLMALYFYDVAIILRDRESLKPSYRQFYLVHHCVSFILFAVWHVSFIPFTDAMALGALLWVSSDVWRWAEQYWRLSGHVSSERLKDIVYYLERGHRVFAYGLYLIILDFQFNYTSELVLLASGILMDAIDTWFQRRVRHYRKQKQDKISSPAAREEPLTHDKAA